MPPRPFPIPFLRIDVIAIALLTVWSVPAHAIGLDDCKPLEDGPKRLACYDAATGRTATPAEKQSEKQAEKQAEKQSAKQPVAASPDPTADVSGTGLVARRDKTPPGTKPSSLDERWDLDGTPSPALFSLRPYKPVYILPAFYSSSPTTHPTSGNPDNDATLRGPIDHLEGKFQISMKAKMLENVGFEGSNLWFGYTQSSRWQVYNHATSRPFRETNYEPEIMYSAPTNYALLGLEGKLVGLSLTHQSNGRDLPQSRSWNRIIGQIGLENDDWTLLVRPWLRVREKAEKDDNPDILDYVGRGELIAIRKLGNQQIAVTLRHSLKGGDRSRGSIAVDWAFPLYGYLKGHVQLFSGYGESLIDYNHKQNSIGVGLSVGEWL